MFMPGNSRVKLPNVNYVSLASLSLWQRFACHRT